MTPTRLVRLEQRFDVVSQGLCDLEHRQDLSPARQRSASFQVDRPRDLIEVPSDCRELEHRLTQQQILGSRQRRMSREMRAKKKRHVSRRSDTARRGPLFQPLPIICGEPHMDSPLPSRSIGLQRCRLLDRDRAANRDLEQLSEQRRLIETLPLGYPAETGLCVCRNSTGDNCVSSHSAIVNRRWPVTRGVRRDFPPILHVVLRESVGKSPQYSACPFGRLERNHRLPPKRPLGELMFSAPAMGSAIGEREVFG